MNIALKGQAALSTRNNADFIIGSVYNVMCTYQYFIIKVRTYLKTLLFSDTSTGSSMDWAYDVGKVPLAFGFELRDARNGIYIFILRR